MTYKTNPVLTRLLTVGLVLGLVLTVEPRPVQAQTAIVEKIGGKIVDKVLSAIFGKAIGAIFGGPSPITKEELDRALTHHFKAFKEGLIHDDVAAIKRQNSLYVASASQADRRELILDILGRTSDLQAAIENELNANNFLTLFPAYVFVSNMRLAYLGERFHNDPPGNFDDVKRTLSGEALHSIARVNYFMLHNLPQPQNPSCIHVKKGQHVQILAPGLGFFATPSKKDGCFPKKLMPNKAGPFRYHNDDGWYYYMRRGTTGNQLDLKGPFKNDAIARAQRAYDALTVYNTELVKTKDQLSGWAKLIKEHGSGSDKARAGVKLDAMYLGGWRFFKGKSASLL